MKYIRAVVLGAALMTSGVTFAAAQAVVPVQWGWGHRENDDRQAFRDGYRQGQWDARQGHRADWDDRCRYRENDDRQAFRNGYYQGYREVNAGNRRGDGDGDADDGHRGGWGRGGYGNGGNGGYGNYNSAQQYGYQDGYNDGLGDRNNGHSFRPTHDGNYKHADRGYDPRFGNKDQYKAAYRQAYQQGYQQGYNNGRGNGGWWRR